MRALPETEAGFQDAVIQLARTLGYRVAHFRPARTATGWRTPVLADAAGFPDLVLTRPPRVLFVELKRAGGRLTRLQEAWMRDLEECPGVERYVWRPSDWDEVLEVLRKEVS